MSLESSEQARARGLTQAPRPAPSALRCRSFGLAGAPWLRPPAWSRGCALAGREAPKRQQVPYRKPVRRGVEAAVDGLGKTACQAAVKELGELCLRSSLWGEFLEPTPRLLHRQQPLGTQVGFTQPRGKTPDRPGLPNHRPQEMHRHRGVAILAAAGRKCCLMWVYFLFFSVC